MFFSSVSGKDSLTSGPRNNHQQGTGMMGFFQMKREKSYSESSGVMHIEMESSPEKSEVGLLLDFNQNFEKCLDTELEVRSQSNGNLKESIEDCKENQIH